jgi:hypothetical protein
MMVGRYPVGGLMRNPPRPARKMKKRKSRTPPMNVVGPKRMTNLFQTRIPRRSRYHPLKRFGTTN